MTELPYDFARHKNLWINECLYRRRWNNCPTSLANSKLYPLPKSCQDSRWVTLDLKDLCQPTALQDCTYTLFRSDIYRTSRHHVLHR